jgi:hypothetical protein
MSKFGFYEFVVLLEKLVVAMPNVVVGSDNLHADGYYRSYGPLSQEGIEKIILVIAESKIDQLR